jgi:hypothetical protein
MTTKDTTVAMRRCVGSTRFGIEAHEAPENDFPTQPSAKDGLGRMCHAHWRQYTNALRKAAVARKTAEPTEAAEVAPVAPAHEHTLAASLVDEGEPIEALTQRRVRRPKAQAEPEAEITAG